MVSTKFDPVWPSHKHDMSGCKMPGKATTKFIPRLSCYNAHKLMLTSFVHSHHPVLRLLICCSSALQSCNVTNGDLVLLRKVNRNEGSGRNEPGRQQALQLLQSIQQNQQLLNSLPQSVRTRVLQNDTSVAQEIIRSSLLCADVYNCPKSLQSLHNHFV